VRHEHYGGAKAARHDELLRRNWVRFTEKWAGRCDVPHGDYVAIEDALQREFEPRELHVPLAAPAEPAPALPASSEVTEDSNRCSG